MFYYCLLGQPELLSKYANQSVGAEAGSLRRDWIQHGSPPRSTAADSVRVPKVPTLSPSLLIKTASLEGRHFLKNLLRHCLKCLCSMCPRTGWRGRPGMGLRCKAGMLSGVELTKVILANKNLHQGPLNCIGHCVSFPTVPYYPMTTNVMKWHNYSRARL